MDAVDGRGRLLGFVIIAVTLAAVALLFAGQGPAVAAGVLVGLALGVAAGLLGLLWLSRGDGRSFSFRTVLPAEMSPPDGPFMEHMRETAEIAGMDLGPVESIRPIVQSAEAQGVRIVLLAMEHRAAGATLTFEARGGIGVYVPTGMPIVRVTDDEGTLYRTASGGGSGPTSGMRYETTISPAPPPRARVIMVSVDGFMEFDPWSSKTIEGPWVFEVPLG